jgi:hypothetical protein
MEAENDYLRAWDDAAMEDIYAINNVHERRLSTSTDQALRLGYAIAMTRDQAPQGPDAWNQAALTYAGITLMEPDEEQAVNARRNAAVHANWELLGYEKIDPAAQAGTVKSTLDLIRLVGYVPRHADEASS